MSDLIEAESAPGPLAAPLHAGVDAISQGQSIAFRQYVKSVLPADGYVFWIASGRVIQIPGSLHWSSERVQAEDETLGQNRMVFTAETPITEFTDAAPASLWVGSFPTGGNPPALRFAFSSRASFYFQAGLWHYRGDAVYPALASQLIDNAAQLPSAPIVSNSLPIWLSQTAFGPVYPSFLVPDNVQPPYIVAHVEPQQTAALQGFPLYQGWPSSIPEPLQPTLYDLTSQQLCQDKVRLTLYGFNNQKALQYLSLLIDYSVNTDAFGFMNSPVPMDEKRTQREMAVVAMKKRIDIDASYYQSTADAVARRLIVQALVTTTAKAA